MDPNETLKQIREVLGLIDTENDPVRIGYAYDALVELVRALDEWLTSGGFPPRDWVIDAKKLKMP